MCFGELPSVNDTLFSLSKRSHRFIEPPLFRAGFAIPEGAPLSDDHCIKNEVFKSGNMTLLTNFMLVAFAFFELVLRAN